MADLRRTGMKIRRSRLPQIRLAEFEAFAQRRGVVRLGGEELAQVEGGGEPLLVRLVVGGLDTMPGE